MKKYLVVLEQTGTSVGAYIPDLPGCVAVGKTEAEVTRLIEEAVALHLAGMREAKLPIPRAKRQSGLRQGRVTATRRHAAVV